MEITKFIPTDVYDQLERLKDIPNFNDLFLNSVADNGCITLPNRQYDWEEKSEEMGELFEPLNKANVVLSKFCDWCVELAAEQQDEDQLSQFESIGTLQSNWRVKREAGNYFLTYPYAAGIFELLHQLGFPLEERLQERPRVRNSFINLPFHVKSFVRISLVVPHQQLPKVLSDLIQAFLEDENLFYYVERVELAAGRGKELPQSPTLHVCLNARVVTTHRHVVIKEILAKILPLTRSLPLSQASHWHGMSAGKNVFLSQGYNTYKRFLQLLGVLDEVYQKNNNYAFLIQ